MQCCREGGAGHENYGVDASSHNTIIIMVHLKHYGMFEGSTNILRAGYGQGTGPIVLDDVACVGTETRLIDCPARPVGTHNCNHGEDAGVICTPIVTPGPGKNSLL